MAPPIRTRPSFALSQSLPSGSFRKPLTLLHQRADRLKTTVTENYAIWSHGPHKTLATSMKLWAMPCRATQDEQGMMESSDKTRPTRKGNGKPCQSSCLENPVNSMKRQKYRTLKDEFPRLVGAQYATGDQWRNYSRKTEEMEPQKNNTHLWMWLLMEVKLML